MVSRQALLKQWKLIESVGSVQGAWTSLFFSQTKLVAHVSKKIACSNWFWMDLEPTMYHSYYYRSVHEPSFIDGWFSFRFIDRQMRYGILHIERWHYSMAFRNLWECGYKELLSARSGAHDYYMDGDGFSFVRGKWMVALKKNARLILILRLRGEDSRLIPGRTRRERFNDSGGRQRFRTSVMLSVSLPPFSDAPFH